MGEIRGEGQAMKCTNGYTILPGEDSCGDPMYVIEGHVSGAIAQECVLEMEREWAAEVPVDDLTCTHRYLQESPAEYQTEWILQHGPGVTFRPVTVVRFG